MKKIGVLIIVVLLLTACGTETGDVQEVDNAGDSALNSEDTGDASSSDQSREELRGDFGETALPPATQLVVGTLLLEETELALDTELAAALVPYWKLYINLTESDTTAPEELDALVTEIEGLMTTDQINYIAGLQLTQEDMFTLINELGVLEQVRPEGVGDTEGGGFNRPDGIPEGFQPGGEGRPGGGAGMEGMDPEMQATMQAKRAEEGGMFSRMNIPLVEALISLLEGKSSS
ncbi:MAG: hypothetical protein WBB69_03625 [Anaerolineales bacterium]